MTEGVKCLLLLFLTHHVALFLRLDAARNRFVCDDDDGLLVIHDLDKRFADLHGQFLAVLVEEHHAVFEVLGCTAIARPAAADARLKRLILTEEGGRVHEKTMLSLHQTDEFVAGLLTEEENAELLRLLNKLRKGLE